MKKPLLVLVIIASIILFFTGPKGSRPLTITPNDKATFWKEYSDPKAHLTFRYPEGELTNFQVSTKAINTGKVLQQVSEITTTDSESDSTSNSYNVIFAANAVQYKGSLEDFIRENLPETKNSQKQTIIFGDNKGIRITNNSTKRKSYFSYSLFKKNGNVYNFALFSNDKELITGNQILLDKIIATAKFK